jgi:hypothetical protein
MNDALKLRSFEMMAHLNVFESFYLNNFKNIDKYFSAIFNNINE